MTTALARITVTLKKKRKTSVSLLSRDTISIVTGKPDVKHLQPYSTLAFSLLGCLPSGLSSLPFGSLGCRAWGAWKSLNSQTLEQSKKLKLFVEWVRWENFSVQTPSSSTCPKEQLGHVRPSLPDACFHGRKIQTYSQDTHLI